jgi:hypothetical protein
MHDLGFIPRGMRGEQTIFATPATVTALQWKTWEKPRNCSLVHIFCLGGGGGGGGGFTGIAASARGGGGGGGSSGFSQLILPSYAVPRRLFIQVGDGGKGVASGGGTATSGVASFVNVWPVAGANNVIACSSNSTVGGSGGATGTAAAVGAAGSAGPAPTASSMLAGNNGLSLLIPGSGGSAGGAVAGGSPTALTYLTTGPFPGATGGGGTTSADFAGGSITAIANALVSDFQPQPGAAGSNAGSGGIWLPQYMLSYGGMGGGSSNTGPGGNGGNGGPGGGGGGGGGGTTGGRGGDGGAGLVIITAL